MKTISQFLLALFLLSNVQAQPETEVYLSFIGHGLEDLVNISSNPGYDNQPSFLPDGSGVLFSSTRNGQTDVVLYDIKTKTKTWLTNSEGSEYSPIVMPNGTHFSTIILKPDGEQLLWKYPLEGGEPEVVVPDEVIGYHVWYDENTLFSFVLGDSVNPSTLVQFNLENGDREIIASNIGRSLHKIPGTNEISFVDKTTPNEWVIKGYNPESKSFRTITKTYGGGEDYVWKNKSKILMGGPEFFIYGNNQSPGHKDRPYNWKINFTINKLFGKYDTISRLAISNDERWIAIVVSN
ncbi:MAG: hypothetical protein RLN81_01415 [Balneolaceae bacterium]